jgi:hypothetical protein
VSWHSHNLTRDSGAPLAIGSSASHVFDAEGTQHVFYRAMLGGSDHPREGLIEIWWRGGDVPRWGDLFASLGGDARVSLPPLASHVVDAEGTQHVFYEGSARHIFELWWQGGDVARAGDLGIQSGQAKLAGGGLTSHVFSAEGTQHVFFRAGGQIDGEPVDGHIGEFWWRGSEAKQVENLTKRAHGAPLAASATASHVVAAQGTQHVFYRAGQNIIELSWGGGQDWHASDLSDRSSGEAEPAVGTPASHVVDAEGTQHVFYTADNAHIIELWWSNGQDPIARDLTERSSGVGRAPLAASAPTSHVFDAEGSQHVYYVADNGHITELWWRSGEDPHHEDLTYQSGGPPLAITESPRSHVFRAEGTQHVFYTSRDAEIIELWWQS